jgi:hypothetical protein
MGEGAGGGGHEIFALHLVTPSLQTETDTHGQS